MCCSYLHCHCGVRLLDQGRRITCPRLQTRRFRNWLCQSIHLRGARHCRQATRPSRQSTLCVTNGHLDPAVKELALPVLPLCLRGARHQCAAAWGPGRALVEDAVDGSRTHCAWPARWEGAAAGNTAVRQSADSGEAGGVRQRRQRRPPLGRGAGPGALQQ